MDEKEQAVRQGQELLGHTWPEAIHSTDQERVGPWQRQGDRVDVASTETLVWYKVLEIKVFLTAQLGGHQDCG